MANTIKEIELEEKRKRWKHRIETWKDSGISQTEYCRLNNIPKHRFFYWRKKFITQSSSVTFVPLKLKTKSEVAPKSSPICLIIDDRYRLEIHNGFDPATLTRLLQILNS